MKKAWFLMAALLLVFLFASPTHAVSAKTMVADLLAKTGLNYQPLNEHDNIWSLPYVGLENLDEIEIYVWAREAGYVTIYATVFYLEQEPPKSLLWRLLEFNDRMLGMKYLIRDDPDEKGAYLIDCQIDLSLTSINARELKEAIENLVLEIDEDYPELESFLTQVIGRSA
ncbi:MAG: YbjN domain-containing protein [Firmicutes bacterium]|nr:YbjN domain-containing protein [Bacillota bacterium]